MIVCLAADSVTVDDADDCGRLHVTSSLGAVCLEAALRRTGTGSLAEDGTALLDVGVLHARARVAAGAPDWDARWRAMLDYAARKGWLSADGTLLQAHVEAPR